MKLLTPLGLLGLLAIAVLILIYIIRPNYQQKRVSSTYVWKLSLRYKKKNIPVSKLRNIILIICQILALTACAGILARPNQVLKEKIDQTEMIAIIDFSASMRTETGEMTRFERAVDSVVADYNKLPLNGVVSVVAADNKPHFLMERVVKTEDTDVPDQLEKLLSENMACSYGEADIDGALTLCEEVLKNNPTAKVNLYTDTQYSYVPKTINVVSVTGAKEWNAAILNATAQIEENYYAFYVDVACYGRDSVIEVSLDVKGANAEDSMQEGIPFKYTQNVTCSQDMTKTVVFKYFRDDEEIPQEDEKTEYYIIDSKERVFSYQSVNISLSENDSFTEDNNFDIYGGQKEVLKVQYTSSAANSFVNGALFVLQNRLKNFWDIQLTEVKNGEPALDGFDFYIFEHVMPPKMPTDGVVFLFDPDVAPLHSGITLGTVRDFNGRYVFLTEDETHPILSGITTDDIFVSKYMRIRNYDAAYKVLMRCNDDPVLLVRDEPATKDDPARKVVVMSFSVHYSNIALTSNFYMTLSNMFKYFLPPTVTGNAFEVFQEISLQSRGDELNVTKGDEYSETFKTFPSIMTVNIPGTYTLEQTTFSGKEVTEQIYVKVPASESNIWKQEDKLTNPYTQQDDSDYFKDLLIYLAAALVALLFIEWLLHSREEV